MMQSGRAVKTLTLNGVVISLLPKSHYCARYTPDQPVAGFAFESQDGLHAFASDRVRPFYAAVNGLAFTPAGCSIYSEAPRGGEYLTLSGKAARLEALLGGEGWHLPSEQFSGRVDPQAIHAAYILRRLLLADRSDRVLADIALAGLLDAVRRYNFARQESSKHNRSMTVRRLRAVEDLIEARLAGPLTLHDMAAACGLSPGFFLRSFKAATGQTPHRFLMERRVAHARRLLDKKTSTATETAYLTGFSSDAHMTTVFKRVLGIAPSEYRLK